MKSVASLQSGQSKAALDLLSQFERLSKSTVDLLDASGQTLSGGVDGAALRLAILARTGRPGRLDDMVHRLGGNITLEPRVVVRVCDALELLQGGEAADLHSLQVFVNTAWDSPLRQCAMRGIRRLRSASSVPFLIQHLYDNNSQVAYLAVITLAEIVNLNGEFGPGMALFEKDPQKYRDLWHKWWLETGSKQFSLTQPHN